jgi:NADH-quinone oxidoreductase subunit L
MNDLIDYCLILIPALPLAAAVLVALLGPKVLKQFSHLPVILALVVSCACSLILCWQVRQEQANLPAGSQGGFERVTLLWTWADVANAYELKPASPSPLMGEGRGEGLPADAGPRSFRIDVALRADALTAMMLAMVTFVSTLVALFAAGYMEGDRGYWRFFAYIGLFVFSMTMLVSVSNFLLLFVFWEAVGVCSYLLIGFWYQKPEAATAGVKAFLVNRVGDFAFTLALFLIWCTYGTLNYHDTADPDLVRGVLGQSRIALGDFATGGLATAICLLLLAGACGKSAQFPLHVWLPDAMEGPTPVSALIHAATMVTAGVYMVARCTPLFAASPTAQLVVAGIGGFTALLAALIALTQFDLKRVLAYSTISQLGYMFLALGAGTFLGVTGGMFHLFTHAFFKALLFLGAGSVMHAMGGVIDMREFGGLRRLMPWTHVTFLVGCLALAGVFPLAGFWSKDAVLASVHDKVHAIEHEQEHRAAPPDAHAPAEAAAPQPLAAWSDSQLATSRWIYSLLYYSALFTAFLTAFYTFRAYCLTFHGPERIPAQAGHHAHESPGIMLAPLLVLAVCAVFAGLVNIGDFLQSAPSLAAGAIALTRPAHAEFHLLVAGLSTVAALAGIALALFLYLGEQTEARAVKNVMDLRGIERALLVGQFFSPYRLSQNKFYFDELYTALFVWPLRVLAAVAYWIDRWIVDGLVDLAGKLPPAAGTLMRPLQMGLVQFYALAMVLGALILVGARLLWAAN